MQPPQRALPSGRILGPKEPIWAENKLAGGSLNWFTCHLRPTTPTRDWKDFQVKSTDRENEIGRGIFLRGRFAPPRESERKRERDTRDQTRAGIRMLMTKSEHGESLQRADEEMGLESQFDSDLDISLTATLL